MKIKIKAGLIATLLILSMLIVNSTLGFGIDQPVADSELGNDGSRAEPRAKGAYHWGQTRPISEPVFGMNGNINSSSMPEIAVEGEKVYAVWYDNSNLSAYGINCGSDIDIFYRYFNGNSWGPIEVISQNATAWDSDPGTSYYPDIAVENGNVYVVWYDYTNMYSVGTDSDIFYRANLSGGGWGPIQVISEPVFGQDNAYYSYHPRIAVENNKLYVTWYDYTNYNGCGAGSYDIFYRTNLTGSGWEDIQVISEPTPGADNNNGWSYYPKIDVDNSKVYIVWYDDYNYNSANTDSDIFYRCNLTGTSWEPMQVISEPVFNQDQNTGGSYAPSIAVENGQQYVVWDDTNNTNNASDNIATYDVFYITNLTGSGWSPVQVISEPVPYKDLNVGNSEDAIIEVENGEVYVVWEESNNTNGASTDDDIAFRCNRAGTWEPMTILSEPKVGQNINTQGSYDPDIAVSDGKSYVVWYDYNDTFGSFSDGDIFFNCTFLQPELNFPNLAPVFGNTSTVFNYTITYRDVDNEPPSYLNVRINNTNFPMLPADPADINYRDGKVYYYTTQLFIGENYYYQFFTSDGTYSISSIVFNNPDIFNTPPHILTPNNTTAIEDTYYEVVYKYEDIDFFNINQTGHWSFSSDADWLTFSPIYPYPAAPCGILRGTPGNDDVGEFTVNVSLNDSKVVDYREFTLTVMGVNDPPKINTPDVTTTPEDEFYHVVYNATDIDNTPEELQWTINTNAGSWLTVYPEVATINGTPLNEHIGEYWINVSVFDGQYRDRSNFTLNVTNVNDPPVIITQDILNATVDELYSVTYEAEDVDPPPISLEWALTTNAGPWLSINSLLGWLHGTPTEADIGVYWVNVSVNDGLGGIDYHYFDLEVLPIPIINLNPNILTADVTTAFVGEEYAVDYEAEDDRTNITELIWSWNSNATWLKFNKTSGLLYGTPDISHIGIYWVNITVEDGEGGFASHIFDIVVKKPIITPPDNTEPKLSEGKMSPSSGDSDTEFTFTVHYQDPDGDPPESIQVVIDGKSYDMQLRPGQNASDGVYEYKTKLSDGDHSYYFMAYDGTFDAEAADDTPVTEGDAKSTPEIAKAESKEGDLSWMLYLILIIIIVVILIIIFLVLRRKSKKEEYRPQEERRKPDEWVELEEEEEGRMEDEGEAEAEAEAEREEEEDVEDWEIDDTGPEGPGPEAEEEPPVEDEEFIDIDLTESTAPAKPAKGKAPPHKPGIVRRGKSKKKEPPEDFDIEESAEPKKPAKGKPPKKGKKPSKPKKDISPAEEAEKEIEPETEVEPEADMEDIGIEEEPEVVEGEAAVKKKRHKLPLLMRLEESATCNICLGVIKTGLPVIVCTCGKKYHDSCAARVGACPTCDTDLEEHEDLLDDDDD